MRKIVLFVLISFIASNVFANSLTSEQIDRLKSCKRRLSAVDKKTLNETVASLGESSSEGNLQILEAVSKTYTEIVREQNVDTPAKREWLYSMILLNMAYFQLSGGVDDQTKDTLNLLIRKKLKFYLPQQLLGDSRLFHSIE